MARPLRQTQRRQRASEQRHAHHVAKDGSEYGEVRGQPRAGVGAGVMTNDETRMTNTAAAPQRFDRALDAFVIRHSSFVRPHRRRPPGDRPHDHRRRGRIEPSISTPCADRGGTFPLPQRVAGAHFASNRQPPFRAANLTLRMGLSPLLSRTLTPCATTGEMSLSTPCRFFQNQTQ